MSEVILTTEQMIVDMRNCAKFIRDKTPMPEEIAQALDDVARAMANWEERRKLEPK
jgi:hypothetical protein